MAFNLADLVEHTVDAVPDRTALICGDRSATFAELDERANRLAHHLASVGVGERDHVAIYAYNSLEYVEAMLAAYKLRAVPINVNYRYVDEELVYLFDNADVVAVVYQSVFAPHIEAVAPRLPRLRHLVEIADPDARPGDVGPLVAGAVDYESALAAGSPARDFGPRDDGDLYILYTGGTTGLPKGVMWRHEDVWRTLGGGIDFTTGERIEDEHQLARAAAASPESTGLVLAPLMHGAAQWGTLGGLFKGVTNVLLPRFDPHAVWAAVERYDIAVVTITGDAMARPLIEALREGHPDGGGPYDTSALVAISSTAAVFSPVVKDQLFELLPDLFISEAVGSSEGGFNGMRLVEKGATETEGGLINVSLGRDSVVLGDDDRPVQPGEVGRLARGGNVPIGYYKDPVKTAATFIEVDGRRYSVPGDLARLELDGTMTLLGRGSQCINSGGEKIHPEEVESVLKAHPKVFDALVLGVDDERWGQAVAAIVQPRSGETVTLPELVDHCHSRLARYKAPRVLHLVDEVPRQPSGKPDYRRARDLVDDPDAATDRP
ncbi:acyl-CoA synthetase [Dermatobacter hominis]|uniref:acyl-CoA synthetase n=1 Tax=Dermatobacter hominis TaxID=2884263 RepID=UPI001D12B471|nr:acyl-CoA synthetase [Dermatobacter hominis]UDY34959.1 acyl-CoA synthetase [Dermatobacter hominis]